MMRALFLLLALASPALAQPTARYTVTVNEALPGATIPADFFGLSVDTEGVVDPATDGDRWRSANTRLVNLLGMIGPAGVLRVGGNSSDDKFRGSAWVAQTVSEQDASDIASLLTATGWSLIWGLGTKSNDLARATTDATRIAAAVGVGNVEFHIGNEPDEAINCFTATTAYNYCPDAWGNMPDFYTRWSSWRTSLAAAVPGIRFAGPDSASTVNVGGYLAAVGASNIISYTHHFYPFASGSNPGFTIPSMMRTLTGYGYSAVPPPGASVWTGWVSTATTNSLAPRLTEFSAAYTGGRVGVSNTLAAGTWLADISLRFAAMGYASIHPHNGTKFLELGGGTALSPPLPYSLIWQAGGSITTNPSLMGYVLAARAAGGQIIPTTVNGGPGSVGAVSGHAVLGADGKTRIFVINRDLVRPASVTVDRASAWTTANIITLTGRECGARDARLNGAVPDPTTLALTIPARTLARGTPVSLQPCGAAMVEIDP